MIAFVSSELSHFAESQIGPIIAIARKQLLYKEFQVDKITTFCENCSCGRKYDLGLLIQN